MSNETPVDMNVWRLRNAKKDVIEEYMRETNGIANDDEDSGPTRTKVRDTLQKVMNGDLSPEDCDDLL